MYIDTHCHLFLQGEKFSYNPIDIVNNNIKAGVGQMWLSSTNLWDIDKNLEIVKKYPNNLKTFVGFHPEEYREYDSGKIESILKTYCSDKSINPNSPDPKSHIQNPIAGIGEVGIDLHWNDKSTQGIQMEVFEDQIKLALKYNLPVAVHSRDAYEQTLEVLERYQNLKFVWHSYNLSLQKTEYLLNKFNNIYFGFNAVITYKTGLYINDSVKAVPGDKILLETDAPFLSPRTKEANLRGYNTSKGVINVYESVAKTIKISIEDLKQSIFNNCVNFIKQD